MIAAREPGGNGRKLTFGIVPEAGEFEIAVLDLQRASNDASRYTAGERGAGFFGISKPIWGPLVGNKVDKIASVRFRVLLAVVLVVCGCSEKPLPSKSAAGSVDPAAPSIVLKVLHPSVTPKGIKFNVQPNGISAIAVECENATRDTVIQFDNQPLTTVFGNS